MKKIAAIFLCVLMLTVLSGRWTEAASSGGAVEATGSVTMGDTSAAPTPQQSANNPWTGTWESKKTSLFGSDWGTLVLTQNGNTVTGTYDATKDGYDKGTLSGTISGNDHSVMRNGIKNEDESYLFSLIDSGHIEVETTFSRNGVVLPTDNFERVKPTTNTQPTPQPPPSLSPSGGEIDPKLVGIWQCFIPLPNYTSILVYYYFNEDGTFKLTTTEGGEVYQGNYSTSKGRVYFTNISWWRVAADASISEIQTRPDIVSDYKFGTYDSGTEYLAIWMVSRGHNIPIAIEGDTVTGLDRFEKL